MIWLRFHLHALGVALRGIALEPLSWLAGVLVIAVAVLLPMVLHATVGALAPLLRDIAADPEISIFLAPEAPPEATVALRGQLEPLLAAARADTPGARFKLREVPRGEALERFRIEAGRAGGAGALDALKDNPLPDSFIVTASNAAPARLTRLADAARALPGVDLVQLDAAWVQRLAAALGVVTALQWGLAGLLALVVMAVTFNATRVQVLLLRDEIEVARLVGATGGFIRRPFVYRGALLGLAGSTLALGLMALLGHALRAAVTQYGGAEFAALAAAVPVTLQPVEAGAAVVACVLLGAAGGNWSAWRQLRTHP
ncbi:cell division protein FtsX [Derxia lacustris]|uniref:cell division protein FtsX n=1 Tax=Derxia lacustris TaxID=764842 RepID=UPI000A17246A|nr:permease-like cell division protein FtsX [Derxia lacustris]